MSRHMTRWLGAAALLALTAAASGAQSSVGSSSRWRAWVGCWSAAPTTEVFTPASAPIVCVTPDAGNAVNVATIANGKVVSSQRIDASGSEQPVDAKGCSGTERGQWSSDGRRVFLRAVATCDGLKRTTSGVLAFTPTGEWLDVQEIVADSGSAVRVARYRDVGVPSTVPAEIATALGGRSTSVQGARVAAGAPIGSAAVIEATHVSTPAVVEALLLERGQQFSLGARELVALADAGVPGRVTDAMVAVSNPETFAVTHREVRPVRDSARDAEDDVVVGRRIRVYMEPSYGYYSPYGYGYGYYNAYGYGAYSYGAYGYGYPGYYSGSPIIVVNSPTTRETPHGRMVKGRGYTAGDALLTPAAAIPLSSSSPGAVSSPSSGSSQPASSSERTAKPRP